jgi:kinesin family protein 4/21/27
MENLTYTEENRYKVKSRVDLLMKGCSCKSGCDTKRCGCRKNGEACGPGCRCTCVNCKNTEEKQATQNVAEMEDSHYGTLQDDISTIMQNIFGPQESNFLDDSESSEDGDSGSSSDELEGPNPEIHD